MLSILPGACELYLDCHLFRARRTTAHGPTLHAWTFEHRVKACLPPFADPSTTRQRTIQSYHYGELRTYLFYFTESVSQAKVHARLLVSGSQ